MINGIFKYAKKKHYTSLSITSFMGDLEISEKSFKKNHKSDCELVFSKDEELLIERFVMEDEPTLIELGIILAFKTALLMEWTLLPMVLPFPCQWTELWDCNADEAILLSGITKKNCTLITIINIQFFFQIHISCI